jgi:lipopolysaccharide transport system permease protein
VFVLFVGMCAWFNAWPSWRVVALPVFMVLALALALGAGLWLAALTVKFRDFRIVVPFLLQIGIFVTPVGYRTDLLPNWRDLLALNPMTGVVDGFRWCLLADHAAFYLPAFLASVGWSVVLVVTGVWYFRRTERSFADII